MSKNNLKKELLDRVNSQKIRMIPKSVFTSLSLLRFSIFMFFLLFLSASLTCLIFLINIFSPWQNTISRGVFLEDFPHYLFAITLVLGLISTIIFSRIRHNYRYSFWQLFLYTTIISLTLAVLAIVYFQLFTF